MAIKSVSIRIEEEMLEKLGFVADYEGRSVNSHILVLIRENIKKFVRAERRDQREHPTGCQCEAHQEKLMRSRSGQSAASIFSAHTIPQSTNHTHGSATPLPHILYSALSKYGSFSHFATCLSDFILQPVTSE